MIPDLIFKRYLPRGAAPLTLDFERLFDRKSSQSNNIHIILTSEQRLDQINQLKSVLIWFHSNKRMPECPKKRICSISHILTLYKTI